MHRSQLDEIFITDYDSRSLPVIKNADKSNEALLAARADPDRRSAGDRTALSLRCFLHFFTDPPPKIEFGADYR